MFVRIVWSDRPGPKRVPHHWGRIRHVPRTDTDDLGVPATDFPRMTKGLFDRPE